MLVEILVEILVETLIGLCTGVPSENGKIGLSLANYLYKGIIDYNNRKFIPVIVPKAATPPHHAGYEPAFEKQLPSYPH